MNPSRSPGGRRRSRSDDARKPQAAETSDQLVTTTAESAGETSRSVTPSPAGKGPARGYSWPPFEPGHTLTVRHGNRSERAIEAKAQQVRSALFDAYPWLDETQDAITVARFCRVEGRALMLQAGIDAYEDERGPGRAPEYMYERANQTDQLADRIGTKLGLDPSGRAHLRQTVASTEATLSDLEERGRQTAGFQRLALLDGTSDDDGDEPA